jgi:hypothetical protein
MIVDLDLQIGERGPRGAIERVEHSVSPAEAPRVAVRVTKSGVMNSSLVASMIRLTRKAFGDIFP